MYDKKVKRVFFVMEERKMKQAVIGALGGLAVLAAGTFAVGSVSAKGHGQQEKAGVSTVAHKQSGKTDDTADSSSSDGSQTKTDADRFDELSQKEKIATLIKATYVDPENNTDGATGDPTGNIFLKTHYTITIGSNNKLVIDDDGEGAGDTLEHSTMLQEKSDSYQSYSPDSSADDDADTSKSNTYWKAYKTYSKTDLWQNYSANKDTIEQLVSRIDISGASDFDTLPMNQMSMPAGASSSSSDDKSDSDSNSDSNSNDSDSDNNSDDNSNFDDNNSSDNNSDSDDNDSDSNSDSNSSSSQSSADSSSSSDSNDDF